MNVVLVAVVRSIRCVVVNNATKQERERFEMVKNITLLACDTKICRSNKNGQCEELSIFIRRGKCGCIKPKNLYNADGSYKRCLSKDSTP